jgi:hypothetical protein
MCLRTGDHRAKAGHEFGKNSANRYAEPAKDSLLNLKIVTIARP